MIVGGILSVLVGLGMLAAMVAGMIKKRKAASWPTTEASILKSEVTLKEFGGDGGGRCRYVAMVEYAYEVDGEAYECSNISGFNETDGFSDESAAQRIADRYPEGGTATAWYNPESPGEALLSIALSVSDFLWLLLPVVMIVMGIFMVISG